MSPTRKPRIEVTPVVGKVIVTSDGPVVTKDGPNDPHFWRLVAANGETVCYSQTYSNRRGALRGARSIARIAAQADVTVVQA